MILYHNRVPNGWTGETVLLSFVWITELVCDGSSIGEIMYGNTRMYHGKEAGLLLLHLGLDVHTFFGHAHLSLIGSRC